MLDDILGRLDLGPPRSHGRIDLLGAMAMCHAPGIGIALIRDGVVAETTFAGVREFGRNDPVDDHTLFQAGSIAKSVAAACALRLAVPEDVQQQVWMRDGGRCVHCGSTVELQFDHIIPRSKGGRSDDASNIQVLCGPCNRRKSAGFVIR